MVTGALSGYTITDCSVHLPAYGVWWADVALDEPVVLSGAVTLILAGLDLQGTVMSGGPWQGRARYRVAGGAGRWGASIPARSYTNGAGVQTLTVLRDAAEQCGETLDLSTVSGTVGSHYVREAGPASRALGLLAPRAWYVGEDGVTRLGARAEADWTGEATVTDADSAQQRIELAADELAALVPGARVEGLPEGPIVAVDVVHRLTPDKLRTTVWGAATGGSRVGSALQRIVRALQTSDRYRGVWSYRIVAQSGHRLDLQPERVSSGMPDLRHIRMRPGVPGVSADHKLGSMVLVAFVDANPSRPVVVAFDDADAEGFIADELVIGEGTLELARDTDPVEAGHLIWDAGQAQLYWAPTVAGVPGAYQQVAVNPDTPNPPVPGTAGTALTGTITDGRSDVLA